MFDYNDYYFERFIAIIFLIVPFLSLIIIYLHSFMESIILIWYK